MTGIHRRDSESWDSRTFKPSSLHGWVCPQGVTLRGGMGGRQMGTLERRPGPLLLPWDWHDNQALFFVRDGGLQVLWGPCPLSKGDP